MQSQEYVAAIFAQVTEIVVPVPIHPIVAFLVYCVVARAYEYDRPFCEQVFASNNRGVLDE